METLNHVKLKGVLLSSDLEKQISSAVEQKIKTLPNYVDLRANPELILLVCNLIENGTANQKVKTIKPDKKALLLKVLTPIFNYTEADKKHISEIVEFLHCTNQIKKLSSFKLALKYLSDWIKRKFL